MLVRTVELNQKKFVMILNKFKKYIDMLPFVMLWLDLDLNSVTIFSFPQVLVKGSVLCRRGILMLTADNVTVLGGEVDALAETNTPVNSLKQAM